MARGEPGELRNANGGATLSRFAYTRDAVGSPTRIETSDGVETYAYDARDRVTEVCYQASCPLPSDPFLRWSYDPVGNRLTESRPLALTTSYRYDAADRLRSQGPGPVEAITYAYDANGNQTAAGSRTFAYDLESRLTSTSAGGTTTSYGYDGDGKRVEAATGGNLTNYLWDANAELPQLALERDGANGPVRRYLHGLDTISLSTPAGDSYYHYDGLGSVANVTSASGAPQWRYAYEPFGITRAETKIDPTAAANPLRSPASSMTPTAASTTCACASASAAAQATETRDRRPRLRPRHVPPSASPARDRTGDRSPPHRGRPRPRFARTGWSSSPSPGCTSHAAARSLRPPRRDPRGLPRARLLPRLLQEARAIIVTRVLSAPRRPAAPASSRSARWSGRHASPRPRIA